MAAKGRKPNSSMNVKGKHIIIVGAVIVLGIIVFKKRSKKILTDPAATQAIRSSEEAPLQELSQEEPKSYDPKAYKAEVARMRAKYASRAMLGLKSMDLKEKDGLLQIPFRFIPQKIWCQAGDLDTMKRLSKDPSANEFLISLEPSGGGKGDFLRTSVLALYKGIEHTFKLKPSSSHSYGLYICLDGGKGTSCKDKPLKTHSAISAEVANAKDTAKTDYIFYYQHVIFDKNSLEVYKSEDASDDFKKSIASYLKEQKDIDSAEFQAAWNVSKITGSSSADVQGERLQLSLPYNDPRCMGSQ